MKELIKLWKAEEEIAHIHGWDFRILTGGIRKAQTFPGITDR